MKKIPMIAVTVLLLASITGNVLQYSFGAQVPEPPNSITFPNANSRDTYFTIHNIAEAHEISRGAGIKVGVIDWNFNYPAHEELYAAVVDFTDNPRNFTSGHGYWMAVVLKEIAPDCEIYGLGTAIDDYNESDFVDVAVEAIDWSIENGLDILTLSLSRISDDNRARLDEAVDRAVSHGIVTTFIHYDNPNNILPFGMLDYDDEVFPYTRNPDVNIFHYDYNTILVSQYLESGSPASYAGVADGGYIPFFSFSSCPLSQPDLWLYSKA